MENWRRVFVAIWERGSTIDRTNGLRSPSLSRWFTWGAGVLKAAQGDHQVTSGECCAFGTQRYRYSTGLWWILLSCWTFEVEHLRQDILFKPTLKKYKRTVWVWMLYSKWVVLKRWSLLFWNICNIWRD